MIRKVVIRRFKRFSDVTFELDGHIVLAGPNNAGKTTMLQAVAAWDIAYRRWLELNDFNQRNGYVRAPIARQAFSAVPVRAFDLVWNDRKYKGTTIEIEIQWEDPGHRPRQLAMELISDSTEQMYVRPRSDASVRLLQSAEAPQTVYVPPMSGLSTDEPVYTRPKQDQLLGQAKPGEIIRNLLVEAHQSEHWKSLNASVARLFGVELEPPDPRGAHIVAEYRHKSNLPPLDIASGGSGFQQVLMLLAFLYCRPASALLLDEPDAHLHVYLQDAIYSELSAVAARFHSQLIIATHSEVIINSVDPEELCLLLDKPRRLSSAAERDKLVDALAILTHTDIMLALEAPGVLYVEGRTDLDILREWARVLEHPLYDYFASGKLFWKPTVYEHREGGEGIKTKDHYAAVQLVKTIPGLELVDRDAHAGKGDSDITGQGLQRLRWKRYEIESYLFHPDALARYVESMLGTGEAPQAVTELKKWFADTQPPAFVHAPLGDHAFLNGTKARTDLIPPALAAAGLHDIHYTRFHEIAAVMMKDEIHPEVIEKLNMIQKALNL